MRLKWIALVLVALFAIAGIQGWITIRRGFGAQDQPSAAEAFVAQHTLQISIPAKAENLKDPVPSTPEALAEARRHWAIHCAICHGNDGSGDTYIGQNIYPKAPDLRLAAVQSLTDGDLYYIIQNGVRLTAMPAWGGKHDDNNPASWKLVLFVRHLSSLTPEELHEMGKLNPRPPSSNTDSAGN